MQVVSPLRNCVLLSDTMLQANIQQAKFASINAQIELTPQIGRRLQRYLPRLDKTAAETARASVQKWLRGITKHQLCAHSVVGFCARLLNISENSKRHFFVDSNSIHFKTSNDFSLEYPLSEKKLRVS